MPAHVSCFCGKRMTVNEDLHGRKIRCPACDEILVVPGRSADYYEEESWERRRGSNQRSRGGEYGAEYGNLRNTRDLLLPKLISDKLDDEDIEVGEPLDEREEATA